MPNNPITNLPLNTSYPAQINKPCATCQNTTNAQAPVQNFIAEKKDPILKNSPAAIGAINFAAWTGLGYLLDRGIVKLFGTNTSKLGSLALSGVIGLFLGYNSYKSAKNLQKEVNSLDKQA